MSSPINYQLLINIISNLHSFIDEAENSIKAVYANFNNAKNILATRRANDLRQLTNKYNANQNAVKSQAQKIVNDAQAIYNEIAQLEREISENDKYFVKTKIKKEQLLAGVSSGRYNDSQDYFDVLNDIKSRFQSLVLKYSNRKHRGIIDGINYLVSKQRTQDYEELMILENTTLKLIAEINETMPSLTNESLSQFDQNFVLEKTSIENQYSMNMQTLSQDFDNNVDFEADKICERLDSILPDELIDELYSASEKYDSEYGKLNAQRTSFGSYIILGYLTYPYVDFIESPVITALINSKCEKLIENNEIKLPILCSLDNEFNWVIENNDITSNNVAKFTHSLMFGFLSFSPISKVQFCICDLDNRGNSVIPFLELKKKVPEMFFGKVFTSQEEVHDQLIDIKRKIDDFIQNKLGNK